MMIHAIILRSLSTETPIAPLLPGGVSASAVMMKLKYNREAFKVTKKDS